MRTQAYGGRSGKAGLGVLAIAVLGGVTAAAFRQRDREREHESRKDDERAKFVSDLWDAYHKVKAVRRELDGCRDQDAVAGGQARF